MNNENEILEGQEINVSTNATSIGKRILKILVLPFFMFIDTIMLLWLLGVAILTLVLFPIRKPVMKGMSKLSSTVIIHFERFMEALTFRGGNIFLRIVSIILRVLCRGFAIFYDAMAFLVVIEFSLFGIIPALFKTFRGPVKGALKRWRKRIGINIKRIFGVLHRTDYEAMILEYEEEDNALFEKINGINGLEDVHVLKKDGTWDMRFKVNRQ